MKCVYDKKRFLITVIVVALAYFVMDMFFHHVVLGKVYRVETANLWRPLPEIMSYRWVAYVGYLVFSFLFVAIFGQGVDLEKSPKGQGIRYGLMIGLFYWGSHLLLSYPFTPWPNKLYGAWFGIGMVEFAVLGIIVEVLFKRRLS